MSTNVIKLISIAGAGLGFAATLISNWAASKEQENIIEEKIEEALEKRNVGEESC